MDARRGNRMVEMWGTKADERISDYAIGSDVRIEWKDGKTTVIHFQDGILEATIPMEAGG